MEFGEEAAKAPGEPSSKQANRHDAATSRWSVIDIDIMIGESDAPGRGLGSAAIGLVAEVALSDPTVPYVMACARLDNLASQRSFAKAGSRKYREFDDVPNGPHVLLVRHLWDGQVP
jgi:RimJ/RimL family protein N-acetyltransferase